MFKDFVLSGMEGSYWYYAFPHQTTKRVSNDVRGHSWHRNPLMLIHALRPNATYAHIFKFQAPSYKIQVQSPSTLAFSTFVWQPTFNEASQGPFAPYTWNHAQFNETTGA